MAEMWELVLREQQQTLEGIRMNLKSDTQNMLAEQGKYLRIGLGHDATEAVRWNETDGEILGRCLSVCEEFMQHYEDSVSPDVLGISLLPSPAG